MTLGPLLIPQAKIALALTGFAGCDFAIELS
jgi:hypothetical protein